MSAGMEVLHCLWSFSILRCFHGTWTVFSLLCMCVFCGERDICGYTCCFPLHFALFNVVRGCELTHAVRHGVWGSVALAHPHCDYCRGPLRSSSRFQLQPGSYEHRFLSPPRCRRAGTMSPLSPGSTLFWEVPRVCNVVLLRLG